MLKEFLDFVAANQLFGKKDNILLAVSGGIDSMVMVDLFNQSGYKFAIAHCNFQLRGEDSMGDEAFVEALAKGIGAKFHCTRFDTKKYATNKGLSTQIAARELRYQWFEEVVHEQGYQYLAVAHHLNDSLETVFYNLVKGTGISGLTGIPLVNDYIVRPMLFAERVAIEAYARENNIAWREDSSNASNDYSRNIIRNEMLPLLKKINPHIEKTFVNTQRRLQSTALLVQKSCDAFEAKYTKLKDHDLFIDKQGMEATDLVIIDELLKTYGFNISQIVDIKNGLSEVGKLFLSATHQLNIDREFVIISPRAFSNTDTTQIKMGQNTFNNEFFSLSIEKVSCEGTPHFSDDQTTLDFDKLKFPLTVRKWEEGDYFFPLGMKGKKKLSDFMIDNKIPLNLKERVYVLESAGEIAWVIGHRLDDRFKVKSDTQYLLNFRFTYDD